MGLKDKLHHVAEILKPHHNTSTDDDASRSRKSSTSDESVSSAEPSAREKREAEKERRADAQDAERERINLRRRESDERAAREESAALREMYGDRPFEERPGEVALGGPNSFKLSSLLPDSSTELPDPTADASGKVQFRARVHTIRPMSAKLVFIVLRQQTTTIQGVLHAHEDGNGPSQHMIHWASLLPTETLVCVQGTFQRPRSEVTGTRIKEFELCIEGLWAIARPRRGAAFDVYEAEDEDYKRLEQIRELEEKHANAGKPKASRSETAAGDEAESEDELQAVKSQLINTKAHIANRVIDLRAPTNQAIFRVSSTLTTAFRAYLTSPPSVQHLLDHNRGEGKASQPSGSGNGSGAVSGQTPTDTPSRGSSQPFLEIHTPKIQPGATESGASVFPVKYFGRDAFLAQSPQFPKQMCISADFERVYEIGPVFRAENSNDKRHLAEYTGLDLEMTLLHHYHEAMFLIDDLLKSMFAAVYKRNRPELELIKRRYPHDDLVWLDKTPVFAFADAVKMLNESGWKEADGKPADPNEDLSTPAERRIGELVKERFKTDYYILDRFPASARPFYTMLDADDKSVTHSFDIFVRGQEIVTGGQRIHLADDLEDRMTELGMSWDDMDQDYLSGFDLGAPPHAGCGIGLERMLFLLLNLANIRYASLFPRDPKSLPEQPKTDKLRHPEASTDPPPWRQSRRKLNLPEEERKEYQPLEKLIANYGDADNTSWLDDRYKIWRHRETGAAVAYTPAKHDYVILTGNPLCAPRQYEAVLRDFLHYCKHELKMKPLYVLVGNEMEQVLGEKFGWSTLSVAGESRLPDPANIDGGPEVKHKINQAKNHGIELELVGDHAMPPEELVARCDRKVEAWKKSREGAQVHMTEVRPWQDPAHRMFFVARDRDGEIHAMVVMAELASRYGYQVKWALDFPGAAGGAIEALITHAIRAVVDGGETSVTFGSSAVSGLTAGHHLSGVKVRMLSRTYQQISNAFSLAGKGEFRQKLGAEEDAVWVCYPKGRLGSRGAKAIVDFFAD